MIYSIYIDLWMGNLERYMDHAFLTAAFREMDEDPIEIRLMRNKQTGLPARYCFVSFEFEHDAFNVMHKLNGKPIPGTNPIVRFCLNIASRLHRVLGLHINYSVWVGDLSSDVDDYELYRIFGNNYTINSAIVIRDSSGFSKGYGFVRFRTEYEKNMALEEMKGYIGIGSKPLKIGNALPKARKEPAVSVTYAYVYKEQHPIALQQRSNAIAAAGADRVDWTLADHKSFLDIGKINSGTTNADCQLYDPLDCSNLWRNSNF